MSHQWANERVCRHRQRTVLPKPSCAWTYPFSGNALPDDGRQHPFHPGCFPDAAARENVLISMQRCTALAIGSDCLFSAIRHGLPDSVRWQAARKHTLLGTLKRGRSSGSFTRHFGDFCRHCNGSPRCYGLLPSSPWSSIRTECGESRQDEGLPTAQRSSNDKPAT
jgi:hypothetical protein